MNSFDMPDILMADYYSAYRLFMPEARDPDQEARCSGKRKRLSRAKTKGRYGTVENIKRPAAAGRRQGGPTCQTRRGGEPGGLRHTLLTYRFLDGSIGFRCHT